MIVGHHLPMNIYTCWPIKVYNTFIDEFPYTIGIVLPMVNNVSYNLGTLHDIGHDCT